MNRDEFLFKIYSADGKIFESNITLLNVNSADGSFGIMKNHVPLVAYIDISTFDIVDSNVKKYFACSEGVLRVDKDGATIVCGTFENRDELDKDRLLQKKEEAERRISLAGDEELELKSAEISLKKALNRLKLLG